MDFDYYPESSRIGLDVAPAPSHQIFSSSGKDAPVGIQASLEFVAPLFQLSIRFKNRDQHSSNITHCKYEPAGKAELYLLQWKL